MHYYNSALRELCGAGAAGGGVRCLSVVCRSWFWGLFPDCRCRCWQFFCAVRVFVRFLDRCCSELRVLICFDHKAYYTPYTNINAYSVDRSITLAE